MADPARPTPAVARARPDGLRQRVLPALLLVVITLAAYAPGMDAGWIWDDEIIVTGNPYLRDAAGLAHIWFRLETIQMYSPAILTTLWIEYQLWGLRPLGFHLVNLSFHVASVLLLWGVLKRLGARGAWLAAALFAVHPVMVESVVWVSEIKNVQSLFFCLLALLAFLRFRPLDGTEPPGGRKRWALYALALVLFEAALLSKAVAVALPPAILFLVWWKRGRVEKGDVVAVAPMLAMGLASAFLAMFIEHRFAGAAGGVWQLSLLERILVAGRAVWFYAGKLVWPVNLLSVYPRWRVSTSAWWQYLFPLGAVALVAVLWYERRRLGRGPLTAVLCFGVLVSPLTGLFNVAYHLHSFVADHFQYHAAPALFALFASGVASLRARNGRWLGRAVDVGSGVLLLVLALLTARHARTFHDEKTRCLRTIEGNPGAWSAMYNLGLALKVEGNPREALRWYEEALRVTPGNAEVLNNAGVALMSLGDAQGAVRRYREALRASPAYPLAHNNLATALASLGDREGAIREYSEALRLKPDYAEARANLARVLRDLGTALANAGRFADAIGRYEEALRLSPNDAETHNALAMARAWAGQPEEARREFEISLRLDPNSAEAHNNFGTLLASQGHLKEAIAHFEQAVRLRPGYADAHANLGTALASAGQLPAAVAECREAVRLSPQSAEFRERLGVALAQTGKLDEAIAEFQRALEIDPASASARKHLEMARRQRRGGPESR
jgi:tetratricopeptide (TPR) repeat protein